MLLKITNILAKESSMSRAVLSLIALGAVVCLAAPAGLSADTTKADTTKTVTFLDQGWSKETRELFYFTPQGSRMIPYAWFMALETPDGSGRFADSSHLESYGFIPADGPHALNPDALPVGFAIDPVEVPGRGRYLGLTCAACHTGNVTVDGHAIRIDGAPANLDMDRFYSDLAEAVSRTFFDQEVFQKFAARVVADPSSAAVKGLYQQFAEFQETIAADAAIRHPAVESGFGRVDALTQIINALAVVDQGDPGNFRLPKAPTSFPYLWLSPDLEFVQWSPIAASPIGRNGGEVLGVFGTATLTGKSDQPFSSSILIKELRDAEAWIGALKPPKWDEQLVSRIDGPLAARGEALFNQHCAGCHNAPPYRRTDPSANLFGKTFIEIGRVNYQEIGTDLAYVDALVQRVVRTNEVTAPLHDGKSLVSAPKYFGSIVEAVVKQKVSQLDLTKEEKAALSGFRLRPPGKPGGEPEPYAPPAATDLKASPLPGIWATGPFLHNGSVPTILELLSPVEERRTVFWTGGRELDRERLGFQSDYASERFRFDATLPGNRNTGHLYPREGLTHDERMAIIEYLKKL